VCVRVESHAFWVRVRMCPDGPTKAASLINDVTYFVYHPHAPYLLAAKMKAAEAEYIMQVGLLLVHRSDSAKTIISKCWWSRRFLKSRKM